MWHSDGHYNYMAFYPLSRMPPQEIQRLTQELTGLTDLVNEVKIYLKEQRTSSPTMVHSHAFAELLSSLEAIRRELMTPSVASRKLKGCNSFSNAWTNKKWVLEEKQLAGVRRRLEGHKLSLVAVLEISGR